MTDIQRNKKFNKKLKSEEDEQKEVCLWMSFCDPRLPTGKQFLGVVIIKCLGFASAIDTTHKLGINPGGEVQAYEIDPSKINEDHFCTLLTKDDLKEANYI